MRKLILTDINSAAGMPIKSGTLQHIQNAYTEMILEEAKGKVGPSYATSSKYCLSGMIPSLGSGFTFYSAGTVLYNNEVYYSPAQSISDFFFPNVARFYIVQTQYTTNADPVEFSDTSVHNVHDIYNIVLDSGLTSSTVWNLNELIYVNGYKRNPTYTNGSSDPTNPIKYSRDGQVVSIVGKIYNTMGGSVTGTYSLFTLPEGYRPSVAYRNYTSFDASYGHYVPLHISTAGLVELAPGATAMDNTGVYIDIRFNV